MATTHAAMGALLALPLTVVAPELAPAAALGGLVGGYVPDLDLLPPMQHRRTLHFPEYYSALTVALGVVALARPSMLSAGLAFAALGAAVHSITDSLGGGLGSRPWSNDDQRGVYYHYGRRWIPPRRWIRYDGAPEDLLAVVLLSAPGLVALEGLPRQALLAGIAVSVVYTLVRKQLPKIEDRFVG